MKRLVLPAVLVAFVLLALPAGAAARAADRDHDRMADGWEKRFRLSTYRNDAGRDPDRDGLSNLGEYRARTNPRDADTDSDGRRDRHEDPDRDRLTNAAEELTGNHPRDPDSDDDGVKDGREQAGVIVSFEHGELTIDLASGGIVTGAVTDQTDVECGDEDEPGDDPDDFGDDEDAGEDDDLLPLAESSHEEEDGHEGEDDYGEGVDLPFEDGYADEDDEPDPCGAALKPGTPVHEAELALGPGGAVFESIELVE
jgi:hypothetical protein